MAKHYADKPIDQWNTNDLMAYISDQHKERFGVDYVPFGGWNAERGHIARWFGTTKKAGKYDKELVKEFVDHCLATYKPSAKYPGINFGFMATYMTNEFQIVQRAYNRRMKDEEEADEPIEDLSEWFNS